MNALPGNILIIIPTYNEAKNIRPLLEQIFSLKTANLSVLIVDDNSPDHTSKEVRKLQDQYTPLFLIKRSKKSGLAGAYLEGFNYALANNYDIIIQMDGDLSHSPRYIPEMLQLVRDYDVVIGSRYVAGGGVSDWEPSRVVLSKLANRFCQFMLHLPLNDFTSGFKCLRAEVLRKIDVGGLRSEGYSFQIEISLRAFSKGLSMKEIPILYRGRKREKSKMSYSIILEALYRVLRWSALSFYSRIIRSFSFF